MKSSKKLKEGQVYLPTLPSTDHKAAMEGAQSPGEDNPFVTTEYFTENKGIEDRTLSIEIAIPSASWEITHNMNKYPSVTVCDSAGTVVVGAISYVDSNSLVITFNSPFSGTAILN
jgi:hypothetical protein